MPSLIIVKIGNYIDRSIPAVLQGRMTAKLWTDFCNKYDLTVKQLEEFALQCFVSALVGVLLSIVILAIPAIRSSDSYPIGILVIGLVLFFSSLALPAWFHNIQTESIYKDVQKLCEDSSKKQTSLTFQLQCSQARGTDGDIVEVRYIEVCFTEGTASAEEIVYETSSKAVAHYGDLLTATERFEELENLKPFLTDQEYNQKREDIIAAV